MFCASDYFLDRITWKLHHYLMKDNEMTQGERQVTWRREVREGIQEQFGFDQVS